MTSVIEGLCLTYLASELMGRKIIVAFNENNSYPSFSIGCVPNNAKLITSCVEILQVYLSYTMRRGLDLEEHAFDT